MDSRGPYDVRGVANYVLDERQRFGLGTTHLELQKIVYFSHGLCLVRTHAPLVDGYFEAWDHGPVHPYLYQLLKASGSGQITSRCIDKNLLSGATTVVDGPQNYEIRQLISETVLQLRALTPSQLRAKSHAAGGPWHYIRESANTELASRVRIPDNVISERYFRHISPVDADSIGDGHVEDNKIEPYRSGQQRPAGILEEKGRSGKS